MCKWFFLLLPFLTFAETLDVSEVSQGLGHVIGKSLDALGIDLDLDAIVKGLKDESEGKSSPMDEDDCMRAIATLQEEKMERRVEEELNTVDTISNGDFLDEDYSVSTTDSAEYR